MMSDPAPFLLFDAERVGGRHCGGCTLCCKVMPVEQALNKPANQRCRYQSHKGCKVYANLPVVSPSCHVWNCRWLIDPATRELHRPDRSHYVIDCTPDYVGADHHDGQGPQSIMVMQVWIDPDYPECHRDPALRRYMAHVAAAHGMATLIRISGTGRAIAIFAPCLADDGEWHEMDSMVQSAHSDWHNPMQTVHDIADAMRAR
jgi:hypothetical protein